jgi:hypothetical protein
MSARPPVGVLEPERPRRRLVAITCLYALEVEDGHEPPPYTHPRRRRMPHGVMPRPEFARRPGLPDHRLAEAFDVPSNRSP